MLNEWSNGQNALRAETDHSRLGTLAITISVPGHPLCPLRLPFLTKHQSTPETRDDFQRLDTVLCANLHVVTVAIILGRELRVAY